jgi:hypothetical protein
MDGGREDVANGVYAYTTDSSALTPSMQHSIPEYRAPTLPNPLALRYIPRPVSLKYSFVCCPVLRAGGGGSPFSLANASAAARLLLLIGSSIVKLALTSEKKPPSANPAAPERAHFVGQNSIADDVMFDQYFICAS